MTMLPLAQMVPVVAARSSRCKAAGRAPVRVIKIVPGMNGANGANATRVMSVVEATRRETERSHSPRQVRAGVAIPKLSRKQSTSLNAIQNAAVLAMMVIGLRGASGAPALRHVEEAFSVATGGQILQTTAVHLSRAGRASFRIVRTRLAQRPSRVRGVSGANGRSAQASVTVNARIHAHSQQLLRLARRRVLAR